MELFLPMAILVRQPWLALVAGVLFLVASWRTRSRLGFGCAALWLLYGAYEAAIRFRLICSGDCNIRIDLLAIYPLLALATLVGIAAIAHARFIRANN
jgi:hypothetical protein